MAMPTAGLILPGAQLAAAKRLAIFCLDITQHEPLVKRIGDATQAGSPHPFFSKLGSRALKKNEQTACNKHQIYTNRTGRACLRPLQPPRLLCMGCMLHGFLLC